MQKLDYTAIFTAERDMSFKPSTCNQPRRLTAKQIEQYNRDGYLTPLDVLNSDELAVQRQLFDDMLDTDAQGDAYSISGYYRKYAGVYDLVTHPAMVDYACDLLGDNVICWGAHYICKMPGNAKAVTWHQDGPLWPFSPTRAITIWFAVDDSDIENGCMQVIPGSHIQGGVKHINTQDDPTDLNGYRIPDDLVQGEPAPVQLKAGQASIHSDLVLHASLPNQSSRRRCGVAVTYFPASVRDIGVGWNEPTIIFVRGNDPTGHWRHTERPARFGPKDDPVRTA